MLDAAGAIARHRPATAEALRADETTEAALVRWIEIIGEAANHVHSDIVAAHPEVPWLEIVGMRNHVIHGYFDVDHDILWNVITIRLPELVPQIRAILDALPDDHP
jgi:uncharacterized protein with HEPN domain